ncbi:MAG TPA: class I SAM-dependent methyltransferase [Polyangia bacterium]|nr:class I SAM-dependent methyltransferase [Polyangia bacterium]
MPDDVPPDRRPRLTVIRGRKRGGSSAVHEGLVGARKLIGTPYLSDPALRAQYARDIAPRTEAALARVLAALVGPPPSRAIDLGAGTGAVGRTLRARYGDGLDIVAVDRTAAPGVLRANLAVELPAVEGRFDLVVAAHLLNELYAERSPAERTALRAARVLAWTRALLAPAGRLILIEPALRETSRDLLAVRDRLLEAGLHVVAPCFWAGPCPALARDRDWCHDAAPVPSKPRVDFSYLVLTAEPAAPAPLYRVVSDPLPEKGRLRLFVCGPTGRLSLVRLDRHRAPANAALDRATRGDALALDDAQRADDDSLRVAAGTTVALPHRG